MGLSSQVKLAYKIQVGYRLTIFFIQAKKFGFGLGQNRQVRIGSANSGPFCHV